MKTISRTIVAAVLMSKDGKVWLGKKPEGAVYPNSWHMPGGGVNEDESQAQAITREIQEETGIDIHNYPIRLLSDNQEGESQKTDKVTGEILLVKMKFNIYQVDLEQQASDVIVTMNDEFIEYQWVSIPELKQYPHTPPSEKLFRTLGWV